MAIPTSKDARLFYRCAVQRYEDAQILLKACHATGAVYLAGYGIECILKALLLTALAPDSQDKMLESFHGSRAHDYDWLRKQYLKKSRSPFPLEVTEAFTLVNSWSTDLRYTPQNLKMDEAGAFLAATEKIILWAKGRI